MIKFKSFFGSVIAGFLLFGATAYAVQISVPSAPGTGYILTSTTTGAYIAVAGAGTSGHCVQWGASNSLADAGSACGSGGGSSFGYPFPNNATSTTLSFSGGIVANASSTIGTLNLVNALTGVFGGTGSTTLSGILAGNGTSGVKSAVIGTGLSFDGTTLSATNAGTVTSVTGTYPVISSGGTTPAISLAFGTTTTNIWSALNSFNAGLTAFASSTIGGGGVANGLTVSGNATTTGDLKVGPTQTTGNLFVGQKLQIFSNTTNAGFQFLNGSAFGVNSTQVTFSPGVSSGIFINDPNSGLNAILNTGSLASTDKTFTFPNASGTFCLTTTCTGTVTAVSVASTNGFAGTSSGGATPALTLSTTITGLLKGNGTAISTAAAGTDYLAPTGSGAGLTGIPTSVSNSDTTLTITPTTGAVVASLNLAKANAWTSQATTSFAGPILIATTSPNAFSITNGSGAQTVNVNTNPAANAPIFQVQATSTTDTLFQVDQYGHLTASSTPKTPTVSTCGTGTGTLSAGSNDVTGVVTTATAATACTITFGAAYSSTPNVVVSGGSLVGFPAVTAVSTTAFTIGVSAAVTGDAITYVVIMP